MLRRELTTFGKVVGLGGPFIKCVLSQLLLARWLGAVMLGAVIKNNNFRAARYLTGAKRNTKFLTAEIRS
jgi:hypothetical protein